MVHENCVKRVLWLGIVISYVKGVLWLGRVILSECSGWRELSLASVLVGEREGRRYPGSGLNKRKELQQTKSRSVVVYLV